MNDGTIEQDLLTRAIETLTKAIGKKPVGYRAPSWQFSPWTMKQVKDAGFLYDSSLMASDDAYEILLDKHQLPASFFIPAVSHLLHPDMIPLIMKSGRHEIGVHGWIHEHLPSVNDEKAEQEMLTRAIDTLTKAIGKKPVGYRAPSWQFSPWTVGQVKAAGFLYDSSLMASDDAYEILLDKQPTGVVELPIERILDDFPYFGGATNGGMPNPDLIEQVFRAEFDMAYEEGGLFILTMHPHITGHRSRVAGLEKLILHMKSKPGVWFATHEQIARFVKGDGKS